MEILSSSLRERLSILLDIDPVAIGDTTPFADLGVDSMMRLELIALVEQYVGRELPERELNNLGAIDQIIRYVDALSSS
ncbi:MAG TPA: acyl carrier protein [Thermoanaerobaculia bacterium]